MTWSKLRLLVEFPFLGGFPAPRISPRNDGKLRAACIPSGYEHLAALIQALAGFLMDVGGVLGPRGCFKTTIVTRWSLRLCQMPLVRLTVLTGS
jgi:hypothetical protein